MRDALLLLVGAVVAAVIVYASMLSYWQGQVISKGHAFYHPATKKFTFIDEACESCGRSNP